MSSTNEPDHWRDLRASLGAAIREHRLAAGLSQEELAHRAALSRISIIRIEWGERSLTVERLHDIAVALDISPTALLLQNDAEEPRQIHWKGGRAPMSPTSDKPS